MYILLWVVIGVVVVVILCGIDLWQMCMEINVICIDDLVLVQEIVDFIYDCYGLVWVKLFMICLELDLLQMYDVIWIGLCFFFDNVGYYDIYWVKIFCEGWVYDSNCDVGLVQVFSGVGYFICNQWWNDVGIGLCVCLLQQVELSLFNCIVGWVGFLSCIEVDDFVVCVIVVLCQQKMNLGNVYVDYGG